MNLQTPRWTKLSIRANSNAPTRKVSTSAPALWKIKFISVVLFRATKKLHFETLSEHPQDCRERTPHMITNVTIYKFFNRANIKFSATMSVGAKSIKAREKQQMPIGIVKDTSDVTHCC